jgi:STE24 endopeptidase
MVRINALLIVFVAVIVTRSALQVLLRHLNVRHLHRFEGRVPEAFEGRVDREKMARITAYTIDLERVRLIDAVSLQLMTLGVLVSGFLPWVVQKINLAVSNPVGVGLVFFALLWIVYSVPSMCFDLYETFVIENRYGFNTTTLRTWVLDLMKQTVLSAILGGVILGLLLTLIAVHHETWWIWAWIVMAIFEGIMVWLYPLVIAPWFNRFEPIPDRNLKRRIRDTMERAGLSVSGVFQMDAEKRTRHTNAFLTGLGRTKKIVLFDSLLRRHSEEEILAILCHEAGHWKRGHLIKGLVLLEITTLCLFYVASRLLDWPLLYDTFGLSEATAFAGLFLIGVLMTGVGSFLRPVGSALSRRFEEQADDMAVELTGTSTFLVEALRTLSLDNLANLNPHPLYAWFYYSHPPVAERIGRLERGKGMRSSHEAESAPI